MHRHMMKSKLHRAKITEACLEYEGSLTIDQDLLEAADMISHEMVQVYNINNGERFETYVIPGRRGGRDFCLNGAAARKGQAGDRIIIVTSCWLEHEEALKHEPTVVLLDGDNNIKKITHSEDHPLCVAN
jgi:aspartate 1-decarboxylase